MKAVFRMSGICAGALCALLLAASGAGAAVSTDQADYSPGSVVTISGNNSDGAGYLGGEKVDAAVSGPNGYASSCQATANGDGSWSCHVTIASDASAVGGYAYTAKGETSGVQQSGTFADSGCKDAQAILNGTVKTSPDLVASSSTSGQVVTYSVSTPNNRPSGGVPGLIEYCVFTSTPPSTPIALYGGWTAETTGNGYFDFGRPNGNPTNLPFDGTQNVAVGQASLPFGLSFQTIVLHINDPSECESLYGAGASSTCFVLPGSGQQPASAKPPAVANVGDSAGPTYDKTYSWTIAKAVDRAEIDSASTSGTFNYTVSVGHDAGTAGNWHARGSITVSNPNSATLNGVGVSDQIVQSDGTTADPSASCNVDTSQFAGSVGPNSSVSLPYTCSYSAAPATTNESDVATVSWTPTLSDGSTTSASSQTTASAIDWSSATANVRDGSIDVTDTVAGDLGTASYADASPKQFTYAHTVNGTAGTCTTQGNTATFTTNTTATTGSDSKSVKLCAGQDLRVSADGSPTFTRTYGWIISKSVDHGGDNPLDQSNPNGTLHYSVAVSHDGGTDSAWQVNGHVTVSNPNDWESATLTGVTDSIDNGGICAVDTSGANLTVGPGGSVTLPYTCAYASAPSPTTGNDTATATWSASAASTPDGSASSNPDAITFGAPTSIVDGSASVTDSLHGGLGTVSYLDSSPKTIDYAQAITGASGTCSTQANTAAFKTSDTGATGSASTTGEICVGTDVSVSSDGSLSYTRTYGWGIKKSVDRGGLVRSSANSATFRYTVAVSHDGGTDSAWQLAGHVTLSNPNDWEPVYVTGVGDKVDGGATCTVDASSLNAIGSTLAPKGSSGDSVTLPYTCTFASAPPSTVHDTATATWDPFATSTPDGSAADNESYTFGAPTTIVDGSANVSDPLAPSGTFSALSYQGASPASFSYQSTVNGSGGTCTTQNNTATFQTADTGTIGSDSAAAKLCVGADLSAKVDAGATFTRTYGWSVAKSVDRTLAELANGGPATFNYTVKATQTGVADSQWLVSGKVHVTNPNDWEAITANVSASVADGGTCAVSGGTGASVPAGSTVDLPYTCTYGSAPTKSGQQNVAAQVTWDKSAAATPDSSTTPSGSYGFGAPTTTVNPAVTVTDTFNSATTTLGTVTAADSAPFAAKSFTYARTITVPPHGCVTAGNTAQLTQTGQSASKTVEGCGPANTGALTIGYWQNKNGQGLITGAGPSGGTSPLATWLRQYAPFQDLSATANPAAVASYVTTVIKAASAAGSTMNPMLKAQMLATALDVYFSNPALGGNKIGAPGPLGAVGIDLTNIGSISDSSGTSSGSENGSSAFGGANPMSVSNMLAYAASQSNAGGSTWYGNVKATQGLAKDAFDTINNQLAFAP